MSADWCACARRPDVALWGHRCEVMVVKSCVVRSYRCVVMPCRDAMRSDASRPSSARRPLPTVVAHPTPDVLNPCLERCWEPIHSTRGGVGRELPVRNAVTGDRTRPEPHRITTSSQSPSCNPLRATHFCQSTSASPLRASPPSTVAHLSSPIAAHVAGSSVVDTCVRRSLRSSISLFSQSPRRDGEEAGIREDFCPEVSRETLPSHASQAVVRPGTG